VSRAVLFDPGQPFGDVSLSAAKDAAEAIARQRDELVLPIVSRGWIQASILVMVFGFGVMGMLAYGAERWQPSFQAATSTQGLSVGGLNPRGLRRYL
jgi:hypothetical protein